MLLFAVIESSSTHSRWLNLSFMSWHNYLSKWIFHSIFFFLLLCHWMVECHISNHWKREMISILFNKSSCEFRVTRHVNLQKKRKCAKKKNEKNSTIYFLRHSVYNLHSLFFYFWKCLCLSRLHQNAAKVLFWKGEKKREWTFPVQVLPSIHITVVTQNLSSIFRKRWKIRWNEKPSFFAVRS